MKVLLKNVLKKLIEKDKSLKEIRKIIDMPDGYCIKCHQKIHV